MTQARLERLKYILQKNVDSKTFEKISAALLSELMGIGIAISKSGFQHGGDCGSSGRNGRRFRIEIKRYSDETSLSDRELLGEIDHALSRDPALEGWFLVATRSVPEQLELDLLRKSDELGLPIVVIDWKEYGFPILAALCTVSPDVLLTHVSTEAGQLARDLGNDAEETRKKLSRDLEVWSLGFERLRALAAAKLNEIWTIPRISVANLGQNASGGASSTTIKRTIVHAALDRWWTGSAIEDAPAAVIGLQGVGKTWATLQWAIERIEEHPMVLVVPASAVAGIGSVSNPRLKQLIAEQIYNLTKNRNPQHWLFRFDRLLHRPQEEGPVLTLILDGMNQEPSAPWLDILKVLQDQDFSGRIRTIAITRNLHFTDRLGSLRGLFIAPEVVEVDIYDINGGGELDQRLKGEGLTRKDLHEDLIELARTPRLFDLVIRLRECINNVEQVTIHRLLWEYGRDTLGTRDGIPFSEQDWRGWLAEVAKHHLDGIRIYSLRTLGEMVDRPDLSNSNVSCRLSEIVDGKFTKQSKIGRYEFAPILVAHALGAALLNHLGDDMSLDRDGVEKKLVEWLDPISGLDEKAEILRAAVSIQLEGDIASAGDINSVLLFEWLRSQNLPEGHRTELACIAAPLCAGLLDVVERSGDIALRTARLLAVNALRSISRSDFDTLSTIIDRCKVWLNVISRDVVPSTVSHNSTEKERAARLINLVGVDENCERIVLGQRVVFVERQNRNPEITVYSLLEGFPLVSVLPVFEAAALAVAIRQYEEFWDGLKWLCLLNDVDFTATASALHAKAMEIAIRKPEAGIHSELGARVAALLLWLSGDEDNEAEAAKINPPLGQYFDYDQDYLVNPGNSLFSLEIRHAAGVLCDDKLPLRQRIERAKKFMLDPNFIPPQQFCEELRREMESFNVTNLDTSLSHTIEDHDWEQAVPALARCAPDLLVKLTQKKLACLSTRPTNQHYPAVIRLQKDYLIADLSSRTAARDLRAFLCIKGSTNAAYAATKLLMFEIQDLEPVEQFARVIEADLKYIDEDFSIVLPPLSCKELDTLVFRFRDRSNKQVNDLLLLLSTIPAALSDYSWKWLARSVVDSDFGHRGAAFKILYTYDANRFGNLLLQYDWGWDSDQHMWCNHYGSLALSTATIEFSFDKIVHKIAPWLILRAVTIRGGSVAEARIAASIVHSIIMTKIDVQDLGSDISVYLDVRAKDPLSFSLTMRTEEPNDPLLQFRLAMDTKELIKARKQAVDIAVERISLARKAGASLYLHNYCPNDFALVIESAPELIDAWIDGHNILTPDFKRRVRLSEGFYLALCEALLTYAPDKGELLWRGLRETLTTRFIGHAGIDELICMIFRVPNIPNSLRSELLGLNNTSLDKGLFDLALAAITNDAEDWLDRVIEEDKESGVVWRRQRARVINGFRVKNKISTIDVWPPGRAGSLRVSRQNVALAWKRSEVFARHWWQRYWEAADDGDAYAAWELLSRCVDRRTLIGMHDLQSILNSDFRRRAHFGLNFEDLESAMKKAEKELDQQFLGRKIVMGIGPWGKEKN